MPAPIHTGKLFVPSQKWSAPQSEAVQHSSNETATFLWVSWKINPIKPDKINAAVVYSNARECKLQCFVDICPPVSSKTQTHFTQKDQNTWLCHTTAIWNHFPKIIIIKQLSGKCLIAPLILADVTQLSFVRNVPNAYPLYFLPCFTFEYYLSSQNNLQSHT